MVGGLYPGHTELLVGVPALAASARLGGVCWGSAETAGVQAHVAQKLEAAGWDPAPEVCREGAPQPAPGNPLHEASIYAARCRPFCGASWE